MNRQALAEASALLQAALSALLASGPSGGPGALLRQTAGALSASAPAAIQAGAVGTPLLACFDAAWRAGVSLDSFALFRGAVLGLRSTQVPAFLIKMTCLRMSLVEECRIIAATTFTSRDVVDQTIDRMVAAFDPLETLAADAGDEAAYEALVTLRAAVVNDLATRSRPLPSMVTYSYPKRMPVLWMANRLYGDANRSDEIIGEVMPVHPLFMPQHGRVLSA